ncbi:MAG: hypothetical protein HY721_19065, partial [Planctomycetes bacterium]|nr:hypothetical protein [Planctomycetota bacterium]
MKPPLKVTLHLKTCALVSAVVLASVSTAALLEGRVRSSLHRRELERRGVALAEAAAYVASSPSAARDNLMVQGLLAGLVRPDGAPRAAALCDVAGVVLLHSNPELQGSTLVDLVPPPESTRVAEEAGPDGARVLLVATPVFRDSEPAGSLRVEVSLKALDLEAAAAAERALWACGALLLLAAGAAFLFARPLTRALGKLA